MRRRPAVFRSSGASPSSTGTPSPPPVFTSRIGAPASIRLRVIEATRSSISPRSPRPGVRYPSPPRAPCTVSIGEAVSACDVDGVGDLLGVDAELRGAPARVLRGPAPTVGGSRARVHAEFHRRAGGPAPEPLQLREQVEVEMHACLEQRVEVAFGDVRAGEGIPHAGHPWALAQATSPGERASIPSHGQRSRSKARTAGSRWALSASRTTPGSPAAASASRSASACSWIRGRS